MYIKLKIEFQIESDKNVTCSYTLSKIFTNDKGILSFQWSSELSSKTATHSLWIFTKSDIHLFLAKSATTPQSSKITPNYGPLFLSAVHNMLLENMLVYYGMTIINYRLNFP